MEDFKKIISGIDSLWNDINNEIIIKAILSDIDKNRLNIEAKTNTIPNQFGIYVFFIKPKSSYMNFEALANDWVKNDFKNYPKIIKKRFKLISKHGEWFSLYVGKSEKVGKRILEHLTHKKSHATYGLKLSERTDFKEKNEIQFGYWVFPDVKASNEVKQFIITSFEKQIREKLNPWVGKQ